MEEFVEDLLRARGLAPDYVCAASASEVDAEDAWWAAEDAEVDTWTESDVAEMAAQRASELAPRLFKSFSQLGEAIGDAITKEFSVRSDPGRGTHGKIVN